MKNRQGKAPFETVGVSFGIAIALANAIGVGGCEGKPPSDAPPLAHVQTELVAPPADRGPASVLEVTERDGPCGRVYLGRVNTFTYNYGQPFPEWWALGQCPDFPEPVDLSQAERAFLAQNGIDPTALDDSAVCRQRAVCSLTNVFCWPDASGIGPGMGTFDGICAWECAVDEDARCLDEHFCDGEFGVSVRFSEGTVKVRGDAPFQVAAAYQSGLVILDDEDVVTVKRRARPDDPVANLTFEVTPPAGKLVSSWLVNDSTGTRLALGPGLASGGTIEIPVAVPCGDATLSIDFFPAPTAAPEILVPPVLPAPPLPNAGPGLAVGSDAATFTE